MTNLSVQGLQLLLGFLGVLCLLAAIIGGGFKIFGAEFPEIKSKLAKILLAVFGVILIAVPTVWAVQPSTNLLNFVSPTDPPADLGRAIPLNFTGANFVLHPAGLAVDNKGTLYVADHDHNRLLTLASDASTPTEMQQFAGTNALAWPSGVAVDNAGTLYVADSSNNRVLKLAAGAGSNPIEMKEFSGPRYSLDGPLAVAVDSRFNVYVADTDHRRVLELPAGSTTPIELPFTSPHLLTPAGVAVDNSFNVYVTDVDAKRIFKLTKTTPPQQIPIFSYAGLWGPTGIAVDDHDNVYVTDNSNQVQRLPAGSTSAAPLNFAGSNLAVPTGVAVDNSFNVYVANWASGVVFKLPPPPPK